MDLDDVRGLVAFNRWANARLFDAAATLPSGKVAEPVGGSFGTLIGIFRHIVGAEWVWLERFHGRMPRAFDGGESLGTLDRVRSRSEEVGAAFAAYVEALSEADIDRVVAYTSFKGDALEETLGRLVQHVVNHGTYHRGQAAMALRLLGGDAPSTDLAAFHRPPR